MNGRTALVTFRHASDRTPCGIGFLVGRRYLLTCTHVADKAVGADKQVTLYFPHLDGLPERRAMVCHRTATIVPTKGVELTGSDIAVLELVGNLPEHATCLALTNGFSDSDIGKVYGVPTTAQIGDAWSDVRIQAPHQCKRDSIHSLPNQPDVVDQGFSGSPVVIQRAGRAMAAGMVAIVETRAGSPKQAFVIPTPDLRNICREVGIPGFIPPPSHPHPLHERRLHVTLDRTEPWQRLREAMGDARQSGKPLMVLLLGGNQDCPDLLVNRFAQYLAPRLAFPPVNESGQSRSLVIWPGQESHRTLEESLRFLQSNVMESLEYVKDEASRIDMADVAYRNDITPEVMAEHLARSAMPHTFHAMVETHRWSARDERLFDQWRAFWSAIRPDDSRHAVAGVFFLSLAPRPHRPFWKVADSMRHFRALKFFERWSKQGDVLCLALSPVSRIEAKQWIEWELEKGLTLPHGVIQQVTACFDALDSEVSMKELVEKLDACLRNLTFPLREEPCP